MTVNLIRRRSKLAQTLAAAFKDVVEKHCAGTGDTQAELAEMLGISRGYLNNICNGYTPVPCDVLVALTRKVKDYTAIRALGALCHLMVIPYPMGNGRDSGLRELIAAFQREADAICAAKDPNGPAGARCTKAEAAEIEKRGRKLQRIVTQIINEAHAEADVAAKRAGRFDTLAQATAAESR